jgi:hypothetical protein
MGSGNGFDLQKRTKLVDFDPYKLSDFLSRHRSEVAGPTGLHRSVEVHPQPSQDARGLGQALLPPDECRAHV